MKFLKETPFIRQALHARLDLQRASKDLYKTLKTRDSRLFYIVEGKGEMVIEGRPYPLQEDMVFLFKAGTPYEWKVSYADYYAVNFDFCEKYADHTQTHHPLPAQSFTPEMAFDCGKIEDFPALERPLVLYKALGLKRLIQSITAESAITDPFSRPLLSLQLKQTILELLRKNEQSGIADTHYNIKQIIAYINEHFAEPITNAAIAEQFGYNPTYLGRIFKVHTGSTLHQYITEIRVKAATELLTAPDLPIGEICRQVGIPDLFHFSKLFKKQTGLTPTQYRAKT